MTVSRDLFFELVRKSAPREGVNPMREAIILHDSGFIGGLKREVELGIISLKGCYALPARVFSAAMR